ncbi:hypothetical protein ACXR6G_16735 [Ancylomarina sp. YFZ004]
MNIRYQSLVIIAIFFLTGCKGKLNKLNDASQRQYILCAPITTDKAWYDFDNRAPIIEGLDVLHFPITTKNSLAQAYFNQGLVLSYGFNHAEAARSFYYATKLDPDCAMAYWGFAYVLGPNYNAGMESDNYERAYNAIQKAIKLSNHASAKEKALIHALSERYVSGAIENRRPLDIAYSKAMKAVFINFPDDADIGSLYAESLMNLHPWDLWDKAGNAREWTPEIISTLESVFQIDTKHPGAHHFYIHAVEASAEPEKGLYSSQLFDEGLVPGAGHLIHMPSHIYIRTGDYHKGTLSNIRAVEVDRVYVTACNAQGAYPLAYFPHNYHFMAATATLEGNSKWAIKASNKVSEHSNLQLMKLPGWGTIQHYYTIPYYVYVKFGKWKEILDLKNEAPSLKYPEAVRHYARGMAFLGLRDIVSAKNELLALENYSEDESLNKITIWDINSVDVLLQIAKRVLKAEILSSESNYLESIVLLKEAAVIEDGLNYNEPPDWFFSVRHHLGAVQIEAEKYEDAIQTFKEDLERLPKNGWALHGLKLAYLKLKDKKGVSEVDKKLSIVWSTADIKLTTSRIK